MRIAIIDPWCFTPPYNRELCGGLLSLGHEVTLIGQNLGDDNQDSDHSTEGVTTLRLFEAPATWLPRSLTLLAKGIRHVQGLWKSLQVLRRLRPDVIHVQWLPLPLIDAIFIPLFRRIAPIVLTVHDSNPYNGAGPLLLRLGNRLATSRFDRWIVHNELSERRLIERGLPAERLHRVAHGLLAPLSGDTIAGKGRHDGKVHFLQFGKLKDYKGVDVLLTALGSLDGEQRDRCRVSIVGQPYLDTQHLRELMDRHQLQSFVDLRLDFVSDADMAALFDDADVLVFPYREIDTSGVLMAAIARAIPVVASDIGCFSEMLKDGSEGRLVAPGDPKMLAAVLKDLIGNPAEVEALRTNMALLRQRIPSWQRIGEENDPGL